MTDTQTKITKEQTLQALEQAVKKYGEDWVDPHTVDDDNNTCQYEYLYDPDSDDPLNPEQPTPAHVKRCIVGEVAHILFGTSPLDVGLVEGNHVGQDEFPNRFEEDAIALLREAQDKQDSGYRWGDVLERIRELADQWVEFDAH